ncbi:MAG: ureidoglycolate lyase [Alphaproteobacteria bacterium]|nr:ureidoglycolate lyase [Alphaproteobacteria bacterium]
MPRDIHTEVLTGAAFAPFGDVLEVGGEPDMVINGGMCGRFHDLARMDFGPDGRAGISLFQGQSYRLPLELTMVERHPLGSQAFLPTTSAPFLVVVAADDSGRPGRPRAFVTKPGQGVNYHRGIWHGVLTPLEPACYFVVDRIGAGSNVEEYVFSEPYIIRP